MKRGRPVSTGRPHNKKAKTYATTNEDRNPSAENNQHPMALQKKLPTL